MIKSKSTANILTIALVAGLYLRKTVFWNLDQVCTDACNCFFNQIDEDLKIWAGGINRDNVERASGITNTVHYQIIDGRIYRSEKCLFGQRCKGIEKFLIDIADSIPNVEFVVNVYDHPIFYRDPTQFRGPRTSIIWPPRSNRIRVGLITSRFFDPKSSQCHYWHFPSQMIRSIIT